MQGEEISAAPDLTSRFRAVAFEENLSVRQLTNERGLAREFCRGLFSELARDSFRVLTVEDVISRTLCLSRRMN